MKRILVLVIVLPLLFAMCGQSKFVRSHKGQATYAPPDEIQRTSELAAVWAVDETEQVQAGRLTHWARYSALNAVNHGGAADTFKLFALRNEIVSFQVILVGGASDVDSVSGWLDSLRHSAGSYTIANDSGRTCKELHRYAGRPIEHFVTQYFDIGQGTRHPTDTTVYPGDYDLNRPATQPPDSVSEGWMANWMIPATATGGVFYDSLFQGGYPITVKAYRNQGIVIDVYVSRSAAAGNYYGKLRIYEGGQLSRSIPVHLYVYGSTLSDTTFLASNIIVGSSVFTKHRGLTYDSDNTRTLQDKLFKFFRRNLWGAQAGDNTYNQRAKFLQHHMKYYRGTGFTATAGYDGPGQGVGFPMYFIGPYNMPNRYWDTTGWSSSIWPAPGSISQWDDTADVWEQGFRDSCSTTYPERYIYGPDEPERDRTLQTWIEGRSGTTHASAGVGSALPWFCTMWLDPSFYGDIDVYSVTGFTDTYNAYHQSDAATPPYERASERRAAGDKVGLYNPYGPAPQEPNWYTLDAPLAHARAVTWLAKKYSVDHLWHWIAAFTADWNDQYSGTRDPFFGELLDTDGGGTSGSPHTWVWPSVDPYLGYDFGFDGWIGQLRLKALRRGMQDYQYLVHAQRLGVNVTAVMDSVVGRAFDNYGDDSPPWPSEYTDPDRYPHWKERGYEYERWRRALADSIVARGG